MNQRPVHSADRLSDFEALMWTLERDPQLASGFANITFLDRPADVQRMRARMLRAAALIPQLRRRILTDPANVAPPRWVDDPEFSIERHVRTSHIDGNNSEAAIVDAAMEFCHRPYDPDHPLWEFHLLSGARDGRGVMLQRFHHTVADGVGMMRMSEQFIDLTRDPIEPDPVPLPDPAALPSTVSASRDALGHRLSRTASAIRDGAAGLGQSILDPTRLRETASRSVDVTRALVSEVGAMGKRRSPVWTRRSDDHTLRLVRVPFTPLHDFARAHQVSVNDVFVTAAAGAAGAYHRSSGVDVESLRMAMPVNMRTDRSSGGNAFGMARVLVSADADPLRRLRSVHETLGGVRSSAGVSLMQNLAGIASLLPSRVLVGLTKSQVSSVDFTTSNVRGAPFPVYMAGALVESNHPIGPLAGTAFNLTMLTYNGSMDMGLHIDTGAISQPDLLADCTRDAFDDLLMSKR